MEQKQKNEQVLPVKIVEWLVETTRESALFGRNDP